MPARESPETQALRKTIMSDWYKTKVFGPVTYGHVALIFVVMMTSPLWIGPATNVANLMGGLTGIEPTTGDPLTPGDSTVDNPYELAVHVKCYEGVNVDEAGLGAGTASDQKIRVMKDNAGEPGVLVAVVTTSSGTIQIPGPIYSGTYLWLQPRQAAPDAADPYAGPAVRVYVPHGAGYDAGDTVTFTLYVRDVSAAAPTLAVKDTGLGAINDQSTGYFNTTDTSFQVNIYTVSTDTFYGGQNDDGLSYMVDWQTGDLWENGVFFVWKGLVSQPFTSYTYTFSDPTNVYYVWRVADYLVDDSSLSGEEDFLSIMLATDGSALVEDGTVILDCYDMLKVGTNLVWRGATGASDLTNGAALNPTAITTKVDDT